MRAHLLMAGAALFLLQGSCYSVDYSGHRCTAARPACPSGYACQGEVCVPAGTPATDRIIAFDGPIPRADAVHDGPPPKDKRPPDTSTVCACKIDGTCYQGGAVNPAASCAVCDPAASNNAWTATTPCVMTVVKTGLIDPKGVDLDSSGVFIADSGSHTIRQLVGKNPTVFAGTAGSFGTDNGVATSARFYYPSGVALDKTGAVIVADSSNHRIRRVAGGQVTTLVGSGTQGTLDGTATTTQFSSPRGVDVAGFAVGPGGAYSVLYVVDYASGRIREVLYATTTGAFAGIRTVVVAGDGVNLNAPTSVLAVTMNTIFIADMKNHRILKFAYSSTVAPVNAELVAGATGAPGNQGGDPLAARFNFPDGLAFMPKPGGGSRLFVADHNNHRIRLIDLNPGYDAVSVSTVAGTGAMGAADGPASQATFNGPTELAADYAKRRLYVTEDGNDELRVIQFPPTY